MANGRELNWEFIPEVAACRDRWEYFFFRRAFCVCVLVGNGGRGVEVRWRDVRGCEIGWVMKGGESLKGRRCGLRCWLERVCYGKFGVAICTG